MDEYVLPNARFCIFFYYLLVFRIMDTSHQYTDTVLRRIQDAQAIAVSKSHGSIDPLHLISTIINDSEGVAAQLLLQQ